jgi:hypothetical protein
MAWNTRLQLARRARDNFQHLGGRRLLLQGFAQIIRALPQLVEEPRVLDGDDGLGGEILDKLDLLIGERPDFLAVNDNGTNQLRVFQHRHGQ